MALSSTWARLWRVYAGGDRGDFLRSGICRAGTRAGFAGLAGASGSGVAIGVSEKILIVPARYSRHALCVSSALSRGCGLFKTL